MKPIEEFADIEKEYRAFAAEQIAPHGETVDREARIPPELIRCLASAGHFAGGIPAEYGGQVHLGADPAAATLRYGLLHETLGAASASVQGLVNVHNMAVSAIVRWGNKEQKRQWLPKLASGELTGAVAITEPESGSDAASPGTIATRNGSDYQLDGVKVWITCGQSAGLFLLLASSGEGPVAFLLPRETPGLSVEPIDGILGCRGYMLGKLKLEKCRLPLDHLLGRPRFGLSHIAATALDAGRYNLAWGCTGLARACLDASFDYAQKRRQSGSSISEFQLVQRMISRMMTDVQAARLLCWDAGHARAAKDPGAVKAAAMAKYFASTMVNRVANDALQIHGAHGCGPYYPVQRYWRDARIMEIIEGTTQIMETMIARYGFQERQ